ncbi:MAG: methyltransferase domain-containing protein [Burkholderiales bacterium]|jgi:ubiquinone/menaquinone biosynthesis C-methylase UbiE|nr:methyltransferase domain-containing protein [Nitrosomonas sp.]MCP5276656.1 methyltransferase domain-containing protein [Burkholderiales bacterium]MDR4515783.1 methyltransferase domain-containing protein [Nitrosomonas sp.]
MAGYVGDVAIPYDQNIGPVLFEHYGYEIARRTAERALRDVLEVAAGTGIVTRKLRNVLAQDTQLTAIDISESMLDVARKKFHPHEQVTFQNADATELPFKDEMFDAIVCQFGVMFFDKASAFRETYRTLRHGGRYLFNVWDSEHYNPFASLSFEVLKQFFPSDTPKFLFDPVSCHEIDPIKEMLIRSGFERIVISIQQREHEIPDVLAFARGLIFSPVIFEIRERGGTDPEKIVETFAEALIKKYGSNPTRYPMQAILFEAEKT